MAKYLNKSRYYPKESRDFYKYPSKKVKFTYIQIYSSQNKHIIKYVPKYKPTEQPDDISASNKEPILRSIEDDTTIHPISPKQSQEETKSDSATSIHDEESLEITPLIEIELKTKTGIKYIELHIGDDVKEFVCRIAKENDLPYLVMSAIEYKVKKALSNL